MQYTVTLTSGTLNLRATPSTSGAVVASIPNHAAVTSIVIIPYTSENHTADGKNWKSIEYNGQKGWVAAEYLTLGNVPTVPVVPTVPAYANGVLLPATTIDNNPQTPTGMLTLTEETKKKLKIGAIIVGVAVAGFGIYKMTAGKKQQALPASTAALSGVPRRRKRKTKTTKKSRKATSKSKRKSFKLN